MPKANHETIWYSVDKHRYGSKKRLNRYLFRTYDEANSFQERKNIRSKTFEYKEPVRCELGPA